MYRLRVDDIQGGSKGFIRTYLLGMHLLVIELIAVFMFSADTSTSLSCNELQSIDKAFCRNRS